MLTETAKLKGAVSRRQIIDHLQELKQYPDFAKALKRGEHCTRTIIKEGVSAVKTTPEFKLALADQYFDESSVAELDSELGIVRFPKGKYNWSTAYKKYRFPNGDSMLTFTLIKPRSYEDVWTEELEEKVTSTIHSFDNGKTIWTDARYSHDYESKHVVYDLSNRGQLLKNARSLFNTLQNCTSPQQSQH